MVLEVVEPVFGRVAVGLVVVGLVLGRVAVALGLAVVVATLFGEGAGDFERAAVATAPPATAPAASVATGGGGATGRTDGLGCWSVRFGSSFPWLALAGALMARMV